MDVIEVCQNEHQDSCQPQNYQREILCKVTFNLLSDIGVILTFLGTFLLLDVFGFLEEQTQALCLFEFFSLLQDDSLMILSGSTLHVGSKSGEV